jgi:hypothetical protein
LRPLTHSLTHLLAITSLQASALTLNVLSLAVHFQICASVCLVDKCLDKHSSDHRRLGEKCAENGNLFLYSITSVNCVGADFKLQFARSSQFRVDLNVTRSPGVDPNDIFFRFVIDRSNATMRPNHKARAVARSWRKGAQNATAGEGK